MRSNPEPFSCQLVCGRAENPSSAPVASPRISELQGMSDLRYGAATWEGNESTLQEEALPPDVGGGSEQQCSSADGAGGEGNEARSDPDPYSHKRNKFCHYCGRHVDFFARMAEAINKYETQKLNKVVFRKMFRQKWLGRVQGPGA
eukprot:6666022-Pyramimonas_sp.AAC.1